MMSQSRYGKLL